MEATLLYVVNLILSYKAKTATPAAKARPRKLAPRLDALLVGVGVGTVPVLLTVLLVEGAVTLAV